MTSTRAAILGTVTVALWSVRVAARLLRMVADVLTDVADLADRARSRPAPRTTSAAHQPTLIP